MIVKPECALTGNEKITTPKQKLCQVCAQQALVKHLQPDPQMFVHFLTSAKLCYILHGF